MPPGNGLLPGLDGGLDELNDLSAAHTDQVIMVAAAVELEHRLTTLEVVPGHQPRPFELGQDSVDGGKAHVLAAVEQRLIDILRTQVTPVAVLQYSQDLDARARNLQARLSNLLMLQVTPPRKRRQ